MTQATLAPRGVGVASRAELVVVTRRKFYERLDRLIAEVNAAEDELLGLVPDDRLIAPKPQQYLHLAGMFRRAALGLPDYVNGEQNWPAYALLLHACELALKAFCDQSVADGKPSARAPNHDLQGWYRIAVQYGLSADPHVADGIDILADLHASHYTRYPDNRKTAIPDILNVAHDEGIG